jgi:hypothetical protein
LVAVVGCKQEKPPRLDNPWAWIPAGELNIAEPVLSPKGVKNPRPDQWGFRLLEPAGWYEFSIIPEHYEICFKDADLIAHCEAVDDGFRYGHETVDYLNLGGTK